ncbi:MAG TPA: 3D domain-containing protein [Bryobacteraceae bacterium]|nr:3D domain-containing protein [Bryobacteraceae bacterium]
MGRLPTYLAILVLLTSSLSARVVRRPARQVFEATAFSNLGTTKAGTEPHFGIVAADNGILPLGTRIRVTRAGIYSGNYIVRDTGSKVQGRHIDIFIRNTAAARQFGKKTVRVQVLRWGSGKPVVDAGAQRGALATAGRR